MLTQDNRTWELEEVENHLDMVFNFEVRKRVLYDGDMRETPHYGLEKTDTRTFLPHTFKEGYVPHTLDHVKNLVRAYHAAVGGVGWVQCTWDNAHVVILRPPKGHSVVINGYTVEPTMMLRAGYDATAVVSRLGLFNYLCMNGLFNLDRDKSMTTSINHNAMMEGRIEDLVKSIEDLSHRVQDALDTVRTAAQTEVSMADFIRKVYPLNPDASKRTIQNYEDRVEMIIMRLIRERAARGLDTPDCFGGNFMASAFEAYNAVQGYEQHDARRKGVKNSTDRMVRAVDNRAVRKAASLAFAEV